MRTRMVGGKSVPLTQAEKTARDDEEASEAIRKAGVNLIKKRNILIKSERGQAIQALLDSTKLAAIDNMNEAALDAAIAQL